MWFKKQSQEQKQLFNTLYAMAKKRHGDNISLCKKGTLTFVDGEAIFWYNHNSTHSTHVVKIAYHNYETRWNDKLL